MILRHQGKLMPAESGSSQSLAGTFVVPQEPRGFHTECLSHTLQEGGHRNGLRISGVERLSGLPRRQGKPGNQPSQRLRTNDREQRRAVTGPPARDLDDPQQARNEPAISGPEDEVWTNNFTAVAENHAFGHGAAGTGHGSRVIVGLRFAETTVGAGTVNTACTDIDHSTDTGLLALLNEVSGAPLIDLPGEPAVGTYIGCGVDNNIHIGQERDQAPRDGNIGGRNDNVIVSSPCHRAS